MKRSYAILLVIALLASVYALTMFVFNRCNQFSMNTFPHVQQTCAATDPAVPAVGPFDFVQSFLHSNWVILLPIAVIGLLFLLRYLAKTLRLELDKNGASSLRNISIY